MLTLKKPDGGDVKVDASKVVKADFRQRGRQTLVVLTPDDKTAVAVLETKPSVLEQLNSDRASVQPKPPAAAFDTTTTA